MALQRAISFAARAIFACAVTLIAFDRAESMTGWAFLHDVYSCVES